MKEDFLLLAGVNNEPEIFYTLEGEGKYVGKPSVFMRLFGCNLTCKGFASPGSPHGCDSYISWSVKNRVSFDQLFEIFEKQGFVQNFIDDHAIFKITGGEPFIREKPLIEFIKAFREKYGFLPHIDFETNGTIVPNEFWDREAMATFTVSPKLASNGDPYIKRYNEKALEFHSLANSCFKFVVKSEADIQEIEDNYITPFNLMRSKVYLMPCCGSREELIQNCTQTAEWCKKYGYSFSSRLHLMLWDKALRV